jgi:hypothetical protein
MNKSILVLCFLLSSTAFANNKCDNMVGYQTYLQTKQTLEEFANRQTLTAVAGTAVASEVYRMANPKTFGPYTMEKTKIGNTVVVTKSKTIKVGGSRPLVKGLIAILALIAIKNEYQYWTESRSNMSFPSFIKRYVDGSWNSVKYTAAELLNIFTFQGDSEPLDMELTSDYARNPHKFLVLSPERACEVLQQDTDGKLSSALTEVKRQVTEATHEKTNLEVKPSTPTKAAIANR